MIYVDKTSRIWKKNRDITRCMYSFDGIKHIQYVTSTSLCNFLIWVCKICRCLWMEGIAGARSHHILGEWSLRAVERSIWHNREEVLGQAVTEYCIHDWWKQNDPHLRENLSPAQSFLLFTTFKILCSQIAEFSDSLFVLFCFCFFCFFELWLRIPPYRNTWCSKGMFKVWLLLGKFQWMMWLKFTACSPYSVTFLIKYSARFRWISFIDSRFTTLSMLSMWRSIIRSNNSIFYVTHCCRTPLNLVIRTTQER